MVIYVAYNVFSKAICS